MVSAIAVAGRIGLTAIGDTLEEARRHYYDVKDASTTPRAPPADPEEGSAEEGWVVRLAVMRLLYGFALFIGIAVVVLFLMGAVGGVGRVEGPPCRHRRWL